VGVGWEGLQGGYGLEVYGWEQEKFFKLLWSEQVKILQGRSR